MAGPRARWSSGRRMQIRSKAKPPGLACGWRLGTGRRDRLGAFPLWHPDACARFAPVLTDQRVEFDSEDRTPDRVSWTWHWAKACCVQTVVVSWANTVERRLSNSWRSLSGSWTALPCTTHAPARLARSQRALIPAGPDRVPGLGIRGQINYRMPHGLKAIRQERRSYACLLFRAELDDEPTSR